MESTGKRETGLQSFFTGGKISCQGRENHDASEDKYGGEKYERG